MERIVGKCGCLGSSHGRSGQKETRGLHDAQELKDWIKEGSVRVCEGEMGNVSGTNTGKEKEGISSKACQSWL